MTEVLVRYAHFIGIIVLSSMLVGEHMLLKTQITKQDAKRLAVIDAIYGISAIIVFLAGLTLWLWVGKPSTFYTSNPIFHAKLTLFVLMGLLSIYPTVFLLKLRKSTDGVIDVPKKVINVIRMELLILVIIPLLAVLMAHGYGNH